MSTEDKIRALQGVSRFSDLSESGFFELATRAEEAIAAPGDVLARETSACGDSSLVLIGEASVARNGTFVSRIRAGELIGDPDEVPATVTAVTLMHLLVLGVDAFSVEPRSAI